MRSALVMVVVEPRDLADGDVRERFGFVRYRLRAMAEHTYDTLWVINEETRSTIEQGLP